MRYGICAGIEMLDVIESCGFDYVELNNCVVNAMSEDEFTALCDRLDSGNVKCEALNVFAPGTLKFVGPDVSFQSIYEYAKRSFERIARLGAPILVLGSGKCREIPDGWNFDKGLEQLYKSIVIIGEAAAEYGITVAIEPLNDKETNTLVKTHEVVDMANKINMPNVKLLVDYYHLKMSGEEEEVISGLGEMLAHTHIAATNTRYFPLESDGNDYDCFFDMLKKIGYNGRLSIEGITSDFARDAGNALKLLKSF